MTLKKQRYKFDLKRAVAVWSKRMIRNHDNSKRTLILIRTEFNTGSIQECAHCIQNILILSDSFEKSDPAGGL